MAVISDGSQLFGIDAVYGSFVLESYSRNQTSTRVDLNNSDGTPLGATTVPNRIEVDATIQVGATATAIPDVGDEITLATEAVILTDVTLNETQADYQRFTISGYVKSN